ncbi:hypothetical protein KDX38_25315 [Pseudomonas sp. CDFA 602]|uniref:Uncharacterized protein n=1 Tax=Pseudomonas syringae pv. delphinii TaxID=192088 RepID=A0A3M4K8R2_9PSED|nr:MULTISPECIES: hypothetical protein [Pseudomonas]MCD5996980.1 hypothetical protein [Pseudomonas californiensis]MCD6002505.1 hypothetical protein [Pseudomonas californiensis]RMP18307.1 hypothetical protein ALQ28_200053 [Pseudomonas syringae pv. delphinii]RMQ25710.1 hypothetical protein ALQ08_200287 [Pseudomonas syringae pv. delphinii]
MSDWRSKPRNGKAQFLKHLPLIQSRLKGGETQSAIRLELMQEEGLVISKAQFSRYLKAFNLIQNLPSPTTTSALKSSNLHGTEKNPEPVPTGEKTKSAMDKPQASPGKPMTPADFRKIREDVDRMDLNALISGRGIVYDEK